MNHLKDVLFYDIYKKTDWRMTPHLFILMILVTPDVLSCNHVYPFYAFTWISLLCHGWSTSEWCRDILSFSMNGDNERKPHLINCKNILCTGRLRRFQTIVNRLPSCGSFTVLGVSMAIIPLEIRIKPRRNAFGSSRIIFTDTNNYHFTSIASNVCHFPCLFISARVWTRSK